MKKLIFFLLISTSAFSNDFIKVDEKVTTYPRFSKVEDLATQIEKDFDKDVDKARAAFYWLAINIRYNLKEYYNPIQRAYRFSYKTEAERKQKLQALKDKLVDAAFRNQTGVCEEYAQSFKKICDLLGLEAEVIKGYVRNDASEIRAIPSRTNHAWNAVKINGKWLILDATWAAGYEYNGKWIREFNNYFWDVPTSKIFKTHFPDDNLWVLRFGRMTIDDFYNQPIYSNSFLGTKAELISPIDGIINVKRNEAVFELKIKNLDANSIISYAFSDIRLGHKPVIALDRNTSTLTIKNPKRNTDLVLYINKVDALHFKIEMN